MREQIPSVRAPSLTQAQPKGFRAHSRMPAGFLVEGVVPLNGLEPLTPSLRMPRLIRRYFRGSSRLASP